MIVFFGNMRQLVDYAREKRLNPQRDLVLAGESAERRLQGFTGRIDVVMAGNYDGFSKDQATNLLRRIDHLNSVNGHTKKRAS